MRERIPYRPTNFDVQKYFVVMSLFFVVIGLFQLQWLTNHVKALKTEREMLWSRVSRKLFTRSFLPSGHFNKKTKLPITQQCKDRWGWGGCLPRYNCRWPSLSSNCMCKNSGELGNLITDSSFTKPSIVTEIRKMAGHSPSMHLLRPEGREWVDTWDWAKTSAWLPMVASSTDCSTAVSSMDSKYRVNQREIFCQPKAFVKKFANRYQRKKNFFRVTCPECACAKKVGRAGGCKINTSADHISK